jgi:hypothetical protein
MFHLITYSMVGIGLSAACGFRVFVPMLCLGCAVNAGLLKLSDGWEWIGSAPALAIFAIATLVEVCGYFIPWVDHALDVATTPAAVIAGTIATAACVSEMHPALTWSAGLIAGGGVAAAIQTGTVLARGTSTATTGGFMNWLVAGGEALGSLFMSVLAIVAPVLAFLIVLGLLAMSAFLFVRWRAKRSAAANPGGSQ